ncbi:MAG: hypothetical protein Q8Q09_22040 [Deltaproteobacteria bacterium]|nr:hypothetical protein [Deltaproteobacteria bacterium]
MTAEAWAETQTLRAKSLAHLGRSRDSLALCLAVLADCPEHLDAHILAAHCALALREHSHASELAERALRLAPTSLLARRVYARVLVRQRRWSDASPVANACATDPHASDEDRARALRVATHTQSYPMASLCEQMNRQIASVACDSAALYELLRAAFTLDQHSAIVSLGARLVTSAPHDPAMRAWYAATLLQQGRARDALRCCAVCVRDAPMLPVAWRVATLACVALGLAEDRESVGRALLGAANDGA